MEISVNAKSRQVSIPRQGRIARPEAGDTYARVRRILLAGLCFGVLGSFGCDGGPEARTRGATASQVPPHSESVVATRAVENGSDTDEATRFARDWGIEPLSVNLSAAGYLLDFRYRIIDPEKSRHFGDRGLTPCLVDQESGARMFVPSPPKIGRLQQTAQAPVAGRIHFVLFANPGRFIKPGSKITLVFGDCEIKNLIVNDPAQSPARTLGGRTAAEERSGRRHQGVPRPIAARVP